MNTTRLAILLVSVLLITLLTGCNLDFSSDDGVITGVVFFADTETVVPNPWVAVYAEDTPDVIHMLVQGDDQGRYAVTVIEGNYIALGSTLEAGPFTGLDTAFVVTNDHTAVKTITIEEEAP